MTRQTRKVIPLLFVICLLFYFLIPGASAYSGIDAMPLPMFILFLAIALILIVGGLVSSNKYLAIFGLVIIFLLGGVIEQGELGISTLTTINDTGVQEVTTVYEGYTDDTTHLIGFGLQFLAVVMFVVILVGGEDET